MSRDEYLTTKFGSPERYKSIAGRVAAAAAEEGLTYAVDKMKRQPNTLDCHRLILWAQSSGKARADEAAADGPLFHRGRRPLRPRGAGQGRRRHRHGCRHGARACWRATPTWHASKPAANAAKEAGIDGVPTFIIGGVAAISGAQDPRILANAIEQIANNRDKFLAEAARPPRPAA